MLSMFPASSKRNRTACGSIGRGIPTGRAGKEDDMRFKMAIGVLLLGAAFLSARAGVKLIRDQFSG